MKHRTITYQEMKALFQSLDRETDRLLMLKCEPAILHVLCKDLKSAYDLYQIAYACGYRESGIGPGRKIMVAIRTTAFSLEVPIFQGGNFLLTDDGFNVLIHECNMRLIRNFTRIQKLLENMKIAHQWPVLSPTRMSTKLEIFEIVTESNQTDIIPHTSSSLDDFISALNVQHYALLNWTTKVNTSMIDFFIFSGGRKSLERDLPCIWCLTIRHSDIQCPLEFRQTGNIPSNRWGHSLCQFDSRRMLLVGGRNHHSVFDDAYFLEISDNFSENSIIFHWTQIISYPRPIFYHAASFLGQTRGVLVSGGLSDLHLKYSEFELIGSPCYYLISDNNLANGIETKKFLLEEVDGETEVILSSLSWIPADLPQSVKFRFGHTITHVGAQTFLVLGGNSFDPLAVISPESVEIWDVCFGSTLDISPRTLSLSSSCNALELGFGQRSHHQTISLNNRIYVFGGALRSDTLLGPVSTSVVEIHYLPHTHTLPTVDSTSNRDYSNPAMLMPIHLTKRLKNYLESLHWYDKTRRIASPSPDDLSYVLEITSNNDNVKGVSVSAISSRLINWKAIPVTKGFLDLLMKDSSVFFNLVNVLHEEIPLYIIDIQKIALSKVTSSSNHSKVISYLRQLIPEIMMHTSLNRNILNEELQTQLLQDIPPKFEFVGDIIMIPENSLLMVEWGIHFSFSDILQTILDIFNESQKSRYTRIARKAQIDPGPMRESRVKILHPNQPNISGWVEVIENKIRYGFDITKVM